MVEPISMVLLAALAGGAGGEAGKQAFASLGALVRRPFQRSDGMPAVSSGEAELVALERSTAPENVHALGTALAVRAALDPEFRTGLQQWHDRAKLVRTGDGGVANTVSGGTFHAPVQQGRDFSGTSFPATPPAPPAEPAPGPATSQG
ncbi:hypothetical protein ACFYUY_39065 [Kitasatospora sp. NPDC004745]|uniref:hypothetical protein n=1 Tax=Kitasatospora sp. NPDC004745 TaxID=3364019 RepID=UPI0036913613